MLATHFYCFFMCFLSSNIASSFPFFFARAGWGVGGKQQELDQFLSKAASLDQQRVAEALKVALAQSDWRARSKSLTVVEVSCTISCSSALLPLYQSFSPFFSLTVLVSSSVSETMRHLLDESPSWTTVDSSDSDYYRRAVVGDGMGPDRTGTWSVQVMLRRYLCVCESV